MVHVVIVSFPAPGHINPTLQFAKVLVQRGVEVTFGTTVQGQAYIASSTTVKGISFATISDGLDAEPDVNNSEPHYARRLERHGSVALAELIRSLTASGRQVDCVIFNFLLPWAACVAHDHGLPSALVWPQPVSVLALYYHYLFTSPHLFEDLSKEIQLPTLPTLPPLVTEDLPSFFLPTNTHPHAIPMLKEMFDRILEKKCSWAFANSFDALEQDVIDSLRELNINATGIGPLIPSLTPKTIKQVIKEVQKEEKPDSDAHSNNGESLVAGKDEDKKPETKKSELVEWLDGKSAGSVVYVSFGSIADVKSAQVDELAFGLMEVDHPFVWVIRPPVDYSGFPAGFEEVVSKRGMVVRWCAQVEVLAHPAVGGFVTHSGWNSTLEGLVSGKPMVCVPQWSDQAVNAKIVSHKWKTGLRGRKNDEGFIEREEFKRCVGLLMGEESRKEMRENAAKYKELAKLAIDQGGSSNRNIEAFIDALKPKEEETEKVATIETKTLNAEIPVRTAA